MDQKETFHCFCDKDICLTQKKYSKSDAIHSLLWPALYLVLYAIVILVCILHSKSKCHNPLHNSERFVKHSAKRNTSDNIRYTLKNNAHTRHTCTSCRKIFSKPDSLKEHQRKCHDASSEGNVNIAIDKFKRHETSC